MTGKIKRYLTDRQYRFLVNGALGLNRSMPDEEYLKKVYMARLGKELDLEDPKTFNEKLQWLKLHDRDPEYTTMVDKAAAKGYAAGKIGQEHIIPTLGIYNTFEEIKFDALPAKFVLKCTHDSGGLYICNGSAPFDKRKAKRIINHYLRRDYYSQWREWPYKDVPKRIIAEEYIDSCGNDLTDYKIHCFNGEPKLILVCSDRFSESGLTEDFYSEKWERLELKRPGVPRAKKAAERPAQLEEMLGLARVLSKDIPFVRIDFYIVNGSVLFSEFTLYPASGLTAFEPDEWDEKLGELLELPNC